jgi:5'-nucleotidase
VDLVLSGVNLGFNLGNSIWHSGTLAAAKQAVLLGLRGIALSGPSGLDRECERYKPWIRSVLEVLFTEKLSLVNVNIPREPRGLLWTRVSVRQYDGRIVPIKDPRGREVYWYSVAPLSGAEEKTDRWAVEQSWISMTPLRVDLTDESALNDLMSRRALDWPAAAAISPPVSSPAAAEAVRKDESATVTDP